MKDPRSGGMERGPLCAFALWSGGDYTGNRGESRASAVTVFF
jgi:hypothetical protein